MLWYIWKVIPVSKNIGKCLKKTFGFSCIYMKEASNEMEQRELIWQKPTFRWISINHLNLQQTFVQFVTCIVAGRMSTIFYFSSGLLTLVSNLVISIVQRYLFVSESMRLARCKRWTNKGEMIPAHNGNCSEETWKSINAIGTPKYWMRIMMYNVEQEKRKYSILMEFLVYVFQFLFSSLNFSHLFI